MRYTFPSTEDEEIQLAADLAFAKQLRYEEREAARNAQTTLHERLRSLRKGMMTLQQLATRTGVSVSFLSDMERGRVLPSLETLDRIAAAYNLTIGELLVNVVIVRDPLRDGAE